MPVVYYKDRDGLTVGFEISGDQPSASEQERISRHLSGKPVQQEAPQTPEPGLLGSVGAGVSSGVDQMQAGIYGLAGLYADKQPDKKFLGYSKEDYEKFRQDENQEAASGWQPQGSLSDQKSAYDATRFLAYQLGQTLPATGVGIGGAILTAPIGGIGGAVGGIASFGAASLPQAYNENIETQIATHGKVKDADKAFQTALIQSGIEGIADRALLGFSGALGSMVPGGFKNIVKDATKGAVMKAAKKVGETTIVGVGAEGITEAVQQALVRWQAEKPLGNDDAQREYLESAIIGGILGGTMGGVLGATGAVADFRETKKREQIRADLDQEDQVSLDNVIANRKTRELQAEQAILTEEKLRGPSAPLLEDLRTEQRAPALPGPKTIPETTETVAATDSAPPPDLFTTDEYVKSLEAMRGESFSADNIKQKMKIGRKKAQALFDAMSERGDARLEGNKLVVTPSVDRRYEVRPLAKEDAAPYRVMIQGGRQIGPNFKVPDEAYAFARANKIESFSVVEEETPKTHGVYEVTALKGQKPTSRFVKAYPTSAEARDYANAQNPAFSPATNEIIATEAGKQNIKAKEKQMFGKYLGNVQKLADQILGPGRSAVELLETISSPIEGAVIEGSSNLVNGIGRIQIAYGINNPNLSPDEFQKAIDSVAHHEVLHVAKGAGLFTPKEWRDLVRRANLPVKGKSYTYLERAQVRTSGAPKGASIEEEAVAEMVRDYMRDPTKFQAQPRSLLRRLLDFIKTLGQFAGDSERGRQTLEAFTSGKMAGRPTDTSREALYGTYYSSVQIPGFYLKSAKYFEGIAEINPNQTYPGMQWLGMVRKVVKPDELKWLGLEDWLKGQNKVGVKDILQYIAANSVDIRERVASKDSERKQFVIEPDIEELRTYHEGTTQAGGEDYKEWVFHMPHLQPEFSQAFHLGDFPNVIAFGRTKTRTIDGKKTLFIEEMQSDLHQKGRKQGYTSQSDLIRLHELNHERQKLVEISNKFPMQWSDMTVQQQQEWFENNTQIQRIDEEINELEKILTIPEAPFKTNWHEFVVKRLVRYAAENGFDAISWNAEPEGVRLTEHYPNIRTRADEEGKEIHEIVFDEGWDDEPDLVKDVTGIVNFYTKRLPRDITKLLKPFGGGEPYIAPRIEPEKADLRLEDIYFDINDFIGDMTEIARFEPDLKGKLNKAIQVARGQRTFDPMAALEAAQVPLGRLDEYINRIVPEFEGENKLDEFGNPNVARWMVDITPELKESATGEGFPMFSAVSRKAPDTPEFRKWFGASKVVGDDGQPLMLFHGTLKNFDKFRGGRPDAAVGAGYYFTNEPDDASYNYASPNGPDQIYKMQKATDELIANADEEIITDDDGIAGEVRAEFQEHGGAVIPVYLSIKNPLVLDGANSTNLTDAQIKAMENTATDLEEDYLNFNAERVVRELEWFRDLGGTRNAEAISRALQQNGGLMDAIDPWSGMEVARETIRQMFEGAGFDGIIMKSVNKRFRWFSHVNDDTIHYIAFKPNQIKSVNNTGEFNPEDNRFMFSAVVPRYSAQATMGQRVPSRPPVDKLADVEARTTYNNIAPMLEKAFGWVMDKPTATKLAEGTIIGLQDKMQPLAKLVDRIRANGGMISNETDTYMREQLMSGKTDVKIQNNKKEFYEPLVKAVTGLSVKKADVDELLARHPSNIADVNGTPRETSAVRSILNNYQDPKLAMAELYLYAQHAKERNAVMRERNEQLADKRPDQFEHGSGMSDFEADDVLQFIGSKPYAREFIDLSNPNSIRSLYRKLIQNTNDTRVDGGLTPDFRKMFDKNGNPLDRYQDYAPLRGYTDDNPDGDHDEMTNAYARAGRGLKLLGKEDKNALGRGSTASNLIAHAILQNEEAIIRAERNKVAQTFLNMLTENMGITLPGPNGIPNTLSDFAEIVPLQTQKAVYDRKSGRVRMQNRTRKLDPDIMIVKHAGQETGIHIKDHRLREALIPQSLLGPQGQSALQKGLLRFNRFLAAMRTSYNPEFLLSNFFRDLEAALVNLGEMDIEGIRRSVASEALPAAMGVYKSLRGGNSPWKAEFDEFAARGGRTAFMGLRDLETTIERITKELQTDPEGNWEKIKSMGRGLRDLVEASNDAIENGVRVAIYKNVRDKLLSASKTPNDPKTIDAIKNRAAFIAKNTTINFNLGGNLKPTMNSWFLFFNASLQGSAALINPLIRSRYVRRMWMSAMAAGALQDIILSTLSAVGDDGQKEYDKIPDWVLENNMILFNPFSERGYIKIPMPYLFNAAWNAGRATMKGIRGGSSMGEAINSVMGTAASSLNPWGIGGHWLNYVAPTVADPLVDLAVNTNFMEAPITPPENPFGHGDVPSQRYWNNTSPFFVTVAEWLDLASGGDAVFPGMVSYSPNQYEYAFEFFGGGAMSTILRAWDFIAPEAIGGAGRGVKLIQGDDVSANDIPFFRRFVGNITTREDLGGYINRRDDVLKVREALRDALKAGDTEKYQAIMEKYPEAYRISARINAIENRRRKIGSRIKKIRETNRLTEEQKTKLIEKLKEQQQTLVNQGNAIMSGI